MNSIREAYQVALAVKALDNVGIKRTRKMKLSDVLQKLSNKLEELNLKSKDEIYSKLL